MGYKSADDLALLCTRITSMLGQQDRVVVAVAGPPASGKSTLAEELVAYLNAQKPDQANLLPMDGFHLDNKILEAKGLLDRKGAPSTFDFDGLKSLIVRVRSPEHPVYVPVFDRSRDLAIAGAGTISPHTDIVVVEGNYLLLDQDPWSDLKSLFDLSVFIQTDIDELRCRLIQRWLDYGHDEQGAKDRANNNDIPNALLVAQNSQPADYTIRQ